MRPIKFRGRNIDTGEFVFGDLRIIGIRPHIFKEAQCYYDEELIEVDEDSVAQLVGYDANGNEVYEGDTVIEEYVSGKRQENIAHLVSMTQVPETAEFFFFPVPAPFTTLKEADK